MSRTEEGMWLEGIHPMCERDERDAVPVNNETICYRGPSMEHGARCEDCDIMLDKGEEIVIFLINDLGVRSLVCAECYDSPPPPEHLPEEGETT